MINEIAMALMFVALFVLVLFAVIVGSRVSKTKTQPAPERMEEPPKAPPKTREPSVEERPPVEVEQAPVSRDVFEDEEQYLQVPESEFLMPEQSVEIPGLELEVPEPETEFSESGVELPEPEIESMLESDEGESEVVLPEPMLPETPKTEEPAVDEITFEETYREPDYFKDDDVSPVQGVTTCPHCGEKVPATLYCINCGKSLNE